VVKTGYSLAFLLVFSDFVLYPFYVDCVAFWGLALGTAKASAHTKQIGYWGCLWRFQMAVTHAGFWLLMLGMGNSGSLHTFICFFVQLTGDKLLLPLRGPYATLSRRLRHGHHLYVKSLSSRSRRDGSAHGLIRKKMASSFFFLLCHVKKTTERGCGDTVKAALVTFVF